MNVWNKTYIYLSIIFLPPYFVEKKLTFYKRRKIFVPYGYVRLHQIKVTRLLRHDADSSKLCPTERRGKEKGGYIFGNRKRVKYC